MHKVEPLYSCALSVEQQRPAELNLHTHLISNNASTFIVRAKDDYTHAPYVFSDDLLIVDRSLTPAHDSLVLAVIDNDFVLHHLHQLCRTVPEDEVTVWGVVTHVIHCAVGASA